MELPDYYRDFLLVHNGGTPVNNAFRYPFEGKEYFTAGVRRVWVIDIETRTAKDFRSADQSTTIDEHGSLDAETAFRSRSWGWSKTNTL